VNLLLSTIQHKVFTYDECVYTCTTTLEVLLFKWIHCTCNSRVARIYTTKVLLDEIWNVVPSLNICYGK